MRGSFYWRKTAARPTFLWMFDYTSVVFFLILVVHMRTWTFFLAISFMFFLTVLSKFGFTLGLLIRRLIYLFGGRTRPARGWWHWDRIRGDDN